MAQINWDLVKLLTPIYARDCDGSDIDLLPNALLALEQVLNWRSAFDLKNRSCIEAQAYLALVEAYTHRIAIARNTMDGIIKSVGDLMANMIEQNASSEEMERLIRYSIACMDANKCYQEYDIDELIGIYGKKV